MSIDFSSAEFETEPPLITTSHTPDDENEGSLRPKSLAEYIGQKKAKENLQGELAITLGIPEGEVEQFILDRIGGEDQV